MEGSSEALFRFSTEGILVVDEKGIIARSNPSVERMFLYEKDELLGQSIEQLIPRKLSQAHRQHREKFIHAPQARSMGNGIDLFGLRKDGSEFPVEISLCPYVNKERKFVIAFIIDITVRRLAEEKLRNYSVELEKQVRKRTLILEEAIDELEKTKAELKTSLDKERELNELKSRFVSMASHEFRTPLATILSSVSLIGKYNEKGESEKLQKHIGKIKSSINDLTDILNDFLSVSKLEEGKVECMMEECNLEECISSFVKEVEGITKEGQTISYKHTGHHMAIVDKKLLKNILFNLISNAIKFSPEGKEIEITSAQDKSSVKIAVKDKGIGISKEDQKHLFERFFRAQNAMNIQGTGLGLNIVLKYLDLMGGSINFTSAENKGTTFTITIPQ